MPSKIMPVEILRTKRQQCLGWSKSTALYFYSDPKDFSKDFSLRRQAADWLDFIEICRFPFQVICAFTQECSARYVEYTSTEQGDFACVIPANLSLLQHGNRLP